MSRVSTFIKTESRLMVAKGWWGGGWDMTADRCRFSFCNEENVPEPDSNDYGYTTL